MGVCTTDGILSTQIINCDLARQEPVYPGDSELLDSCQWNSVIGFNLEVTLAVLYIQRYIEHVGQCGLFADLDNPCESIDMAREEES